MDHHHDHGHEGHAEHDMGTNVMIANSTTVLTSTTVSKIIKAIENITQETMSGTQTAATMVLRTAAPSLSHDNVYAHHDHTSHGLHDHRYHAAVEATAINNHDHSAHSHGEHVMKMYFHFGFKEVILFDFWEIDSFFGMLVSFIVIFILGAVYESLKTVRIYLQIKEAKRLKKRAHHSDYSVSMSQVEDTTDKTCLPTHHNNTNQLLLGNGDGAVYAPTVAVHDDSIETKFSFINFLKGSTKRTTPLFDQFRLMQAGLYCIQITLAYMLMLVAMTYNVYLTAAVVLGAGFGHWLFAILQSTLSELASDACH